MSFSQKMRWARRAVLAGGAMLATLVTATPAAADGSTSCTYDGSTVELHIVGLIEGWQVTRDKRGAVTFTDLYGETGPLSCSGGGTANRASAIEVYGADIENGSQDLYVYLANSRGVALDISLGGEEEDYDYLYLYLTDASETFSESGGAGLASFTVSGTEVVYVSGQGGADTLSWDGPDQDTVLLFGGPGRDRLFASEFGVVNLNGNDGDDILYGSSRANMMYGGAGDDVLYGEDGDDRLSGDAGADQLIGGPGNDRLNGYDGTRPTSSDFLSGGGNMDTCLREGGDTVESCETIQKA